jgi:hypothetical protein
MDHNRKAAWMSASAPPPSGNHNLRQRSATLQHRRPVLQIAACNFPDYKRMDRHRAFEQQFPEPVIRRPQMIDPDRAVGTNERRFLLNSGETSGSLNQLVINDERGSHMYQYASPAQRPTEIFLSASLKK